MNLMDTLRRRSGINGPRALCSIRYLMCCSVICLASPNGAATDKEATSWNVLDGSRVLAVSPCGKQLALAVWGKDHIIQIWALPGAQVERTITGHKNAVLCLAFSRDGKTLASASSDGTVCLWDTSSWQEKNRIVTDGFLWSVAFSHDGKLLAAAGGHKRKHGFEAILKLFTVPSARETATLQGHKERVVCVAFAPDSKSLYSAGKDGVVLGWDIASGKQTSLLRTYMREVSSLAVAPNGRTLAIGGETRFVELPRRITQSRGDLLLWDPPAERERTWTSHGLDAPTRLSYSPDGTLIAAAGHGREVRIYYARTGKLFTSLTGHTAQVLDVAFVGQDGTLFSLGADRTIKLWDALKRRSE